MEYSIMDSSSWVHTLEATLYKGRGPLAFDNPRKYNAQYSR